MTDLEKMRATYRCMSDDKYIKEYCHSKMSEFWDKNLPREYEQQAYCDVIYFFDDENHIVAVDRRYLGD